MLNVIQKAYFGTPVRGKLNFADLISINVREGGGIFLMLDWIFKNRIRRTPRCIPSLLKNCNSKFGIVKVKFWLSQLITHNPYYPTCHLPLYSSALSIYILYCSMP